MRQGAIAVSESWWLKLERAEHHLQDLDLQLWHYSNSHPYIEERAACQQHSDCRRYVLRITRQPSTDMAIVAGEAAHAIRSALDHIAVALAPAEFKDSASFPIFAQNIANNAEALRRFNRAVRGMDPEAIAIIQDYQPYQLGPDKTAVRAHALQIVSVIDNADKHQHFAVLAAGLTDTVTHITARGEPLQQAHERGAFVHDGAELAHFGWSAAMPPLNESEVTVRTRGIAHIAVDVGLDAGLIYLRELRTSLTYVRDHVIPDLEAFARK